MKTAPTVQVDFIAFSAFFCGAVQAVQMSVQHHQAGL
ncbi:hypothetical protein J2Y63_005392 [Shinella sp. BE166]